MLTPYRPHFVEQIFTDQTGRQFRLVFLVSLVEGKLKGELVSAQPVSARSKLDSSKVAPCYLLPISCIINKGNTEYIFPVKPIVSPFSTVEFLITSQPTRAPSHK